jgi:anion-transporting  ArsA/GET3 family ATPase
VSPRIVFVLGKGGVGRSTVSAALGLAAARRGHRVLVLGWTIADPIAPWFGLEPAGTSPVMIAPRLSIATYSLDEALRAYFVDHLHLARFYRRVVHGRAVRALVDATPGIAELLFLGTLWWLTTLAPEEAGLTFDRVIVDAPATGHGASILDMPETLGKMRAAGLLGREIQRVTGMMHDPEWTGAVIVATPEDLAIEESAELLPRAARAMGRPLRAAFVNRAVARLLEEGSIAPLATQLSPAAREAVGTLHEELLGRARAEARLVDLFAGKTERGVTILDDALLARGVTSPREVVERAAVQL